jgi:hypothetical protein
MYWNKTLAIDFFGIKKLSDMKSRIINKIGSAFAFTLIAATGVFLSGCYDKFDPESYKPVFTISGYSATEEIEPQSLAAYWSFDEGVNETLSGNEGNTHETSLVNGFKGQAVNFNATSPSWFTYEAGEEITGLESFTISFWVNPKFVDTDDNNGIDGIIGLVGLSNPERFWGNIEWFIENNSNPDGAIVKVILTHNNSQETDIVVSKYKGLFDNWSNHALTYDAATSTLSYYINGSPLATKTTPWTGPIAFVNSGPMVFGTVQFQTTPSLANHGTEPWASYLTGTIDEVRIYNKALTQEQVNALVVLQGKGK